jgi:hypothetical protein
LESQISCSTALAQALPLLRNHSKLSKPAHMRCTVKPKLSYLAEALLVSFIISSA